MVTDNEVHIVRLDTVTFHTYAVKAAYVLRIIRNNETILRVNSQSGLVIAYM